MKQLAIVFAGGGIGAAMRYWITGAIYNALASQFPYGTMVVNVSGCLLIGFLMSVLSERFLVDPGLRLFLTAGILGGFTTFSTFSYETIQLFRDGQYAEAMVNVFVTSVLTLLATWIGLVAGKHV